MTPRFIGGALLAAVAAGPAFVLMTLGQMAFFTGSTHMDFLALPLILLFAAAFGFVVALLPSVATAAALASLGRSRRWARHLLTWAAAGLVVGFGVGLAFFAITTGSGDSPGLVPAAGMVALSALPCAMLARWRTAWTD